MPAGFRCLPLVAPLRGLTTLLIAAVLFLSAAPAGADSAKTAATAAEAALRAGNAREASRQYQRAAREASGVAALDYLLMAADAAMQGKDYGEVESLIGQLPPSALDTTQFRRAQTLRASALFASGHTVEAIAVRLSLDPHLSAPERESNHEALWASLQQAPLDEPESSAPDSEVRGWLALAKLARQKAPLEAYEAWRQQYPRHGGEPQIALLLVAPAAASTTTTAKSLPAAPAPASTGPAFGLLLPLTGPLANASKVIRAGATAAAMAAGPEAPTLLALDTSPGLDAALAQATLQGVAAFIGPLRREEAAELATRGTALPTIALNYLDSTRVTASNFITFGLSPEDEARAAADDATANGRQRAVVLVADGDWGNRTVNAFKSQFEARGGTVVDEGRFAATTVDFTSVLKRVLGTASSEQRIKALASTGIKAEAQPTPRGDVDVIFMAVKSPQARLLWPQIKYQRAGGIATYAPAAASDAGNLDIGGVHICDAPWRIDRTGEMVALRGKLATVNPRTADAQRLFALGYDAYNLAHRRLAGALTPNVEMPGLSGVLTLNAEGSVRRRLACNGMVAPVAETAPAEEN